MIFFLFYFKKSYVLLKVEFSKYNQQIGMNEVLI